MIGRDADMSGAGLDHLQNGAKHAKDAAERGVLALGESASTVEVSKELVRAVDEMDDQRAGLVDWWTGGVAHTASGRQYEAFLPLGPFRCVSPSQYSPVLLALDQLSPRSISTQPVRSL